MKGWRLLIGLIVILGLIMIGLLSASMMIGSARRTDEISFRANILTDEGWVMEQFHLLDIETGVSVRVGFWGDGSWTPDGESYNVLFDASDQKEADQAGLYLIDVIRAKLTRSIKDVNGMVTFVSWSPDGKSLGFLLKPVGGVTGVYLYDPQTEEIHNLTGDKNLFVTSFVWSPDSQKIAYVASKFDVWVVALDESLHQLPLKLQYADQPLLWTPDSESLIVKTAEDTTTRTRINITDETRTAIPVCDDSPDRKHKSLLTWHPNGTLTCTRRDPDTRITDIVLVNLETGEFKVMVSEKALIGDLSWSGDGHYLLYQADARELGFNVMAYNEVTQSLTLVRRVEGRNAKWRVRQTQ